MKNIKKIALSLIIVLFLSSGMILAQTEKDLFNQAKLSIFDKKWEKALNHINLLLTQFPNSKYRALSLYYRAKSLFELDQIKDAIKNMEEFIQITSNNTLKEDAIIDILKFHVSLYKKDKDEKYINQILKYLEHDNDFIRFYLAFELSYLKDKKIAGRAVPILQEIMKNEKDSELNDRAKLALMRINPKFLKNVTKHQDFKNSLLKITLYNKIEKKYDMEISIPFALARMALGSLPSDVKADLNNEGFKIDTILKNVMEQGDIFEFKTGEIVVKIWVNNKK